MEGKFFTREGGAEGRDVDWMRVDGLAEVPSNVEASLRVPACGEMIVLMFAADNWCYTSNAGFVRQCNEFHLRLRCTEATREETEKFLVDLFVRVDGCLVRPQPQSLPCPRRGLVLPHPPQHDDDSPVVVALEQEGRDVPHG